MQLPSRPMLRESTKRLGSVRAGVNAWVIRNHPEFYVKRKKLGTHTGLHRLKDAHEFLEIHAKLVESQESVSGVRERYNLWMLARAAARFEGGIAEIGVFRGGTAMILAAAKDEATPLHLFDTFGGMPSTDASHDGIFTPGMFAETTLPEVQKRLSPWKNVHFHPGFFPDSAHDLDPNAMFKLTNIDVDIRSSTLACLEYFYPRTVRGGFIVLHDYNDAGVPGTKTAVTEFMEGKPETVIELWDTQALIVKQ